MSERLVAIVRPDEKGRVALRRWLSREPGLAWRVLVEDGGRRVILEAEGGDDDA